MKETKGKREKKRYLAKSINDSRFDRIPSFVSLEKESKLWRESKYLFWNGDWSVVQSNTSNTIQIVQLKSKRRLSANPPISDVLWGDWQSKVLWEIYKASSKVLGKNFSFWVRYKLHTERIGCCLCIDGDGSQEEWGGSVVGQRIDSGWENMRDSRRRNTRNGNS